MPSSRLAFFCVPAEFIDWLARQQQAGCTVLEHAASGFRGFKCDDWPAYFRTHELFWLSDAVHLVVVADTPRERYPSVVSLIPPYIEDGVLYMAQIGVVVPSPTHPGMRLFHRLKRGWERSLRRPMWVQALDGGPVQETRLVAFTESASTFAKTGHLMARHELNRFFTTPPPRL